MVKIHNDRSNISFNFGNKLFFYGFSNIIAEHYGYCLQVPKPFNISRKDILSPFPFGDIDGIDTKGPQHIITDGTMINKDLSEVIKTCEGKTTITNGYFSNFRYLNPYKHKLREYFKNISLPCDNENDVIILLRDSRVNGSYKTQDSYYLDILNNIKFNRLYVSFDHLERHQDLINKLKKYDPILLDLPIIELFKTITSKKTIISGRGTFCFWACFLSQAEKIYWPIASGSPNMLNCNIIHLKIDDESRYEHIYL
jgi:hypothetical protein